MLVVAGFQGVDEQGNITTLGRGGSDTTAVALAAALIALTTSLSGAATPANGETAIGRGVAFARYETKFAYAAVIAEVAVPIRC